MTALTIDTHKAIQGLKQKGFTEEQAVGVMDVIEAINLDHVASKHDLKELELRLKHDLKEMEWRLVNKMIVTNIGTVIATVTILRYLAVAGG